MSLPARKLAITSTAWSNGIRVYCTHSENSTGSILEISLDQDTNSPAFDKESRNGWRSGATLDAVCASWSALCSISWGNSTSSVRNVSVFYQTNDNVIHETRFDGQNWSVSSFTEIDATAGTAMAAACNENGNHVVFFFQDKDNYVCYRRATNWQWEPAVRISEARPETPIAATGFVTNDIFVFFQLRNLSLQQYSSVFNHISKWSRLMNYPTSSQSFSSMAAVVWPEDDLRVYMQTSDNSDMWAYKRSSDWRFDFDRFDMTVPPPNTDIAAVVQNTSKGYLINLYSVNVEKTQIQQRVLTAGSWRQDNFLTDATLPTIASNQAPGNALIFTGSFPNPRKIGLAAAVWSNGVCSVYCSGNGHIREVSRNLVTQVDSWSYGALDGICAPGSNLCCVFWDDSNAALYYQTADSVIHEMQYNGRTWSVSTFTQSGAMPGTTLAVVQSHNADRVMIFYQNNDNFICCRRATNWVWEPAVHICLARSLAPFTVTTWSDTTDIHLFLQNNYTIQNFSGSFNGNWVKDQYSIPAADPLINMTALSCPGPRIKLYVQRNDNSLLEFSYAPGAFARDMSACIVATAMLPNCGLSALLRNFGNDYSIHVYYGNFHHILQDRVWVSQTSQWQPDSPIVDVTDLIPRALSVPKLIGTDLAVPGDTKLTSQLSNPPSTQRPMAIAATGWSDSIRVYTQSGDGFIREASYDSHTTPWDQDLAIRLGNIFSQADLELRHIHGWQRSTLPKPCAPWSTLCCLSWGEVGSTQNVSVFSQTRDNVLQEMRYDGQNWTLTGFIQSDVMPGTAMAEVHNDNASGVLFFFQDSYGFLCYRLAIDWVWEPAVRICQAATVTPIAATTWSNGADVRLYFQDKTNHVREFCITFRNGDLYDGDWVLGDLKMTGFLPGSMSAISWPGPQIRVYMQATDNSVREMSCGRDFVYKFYQFVSNPERNEAGKNTAIAAFRSTPWGFISLYWAGSDKVLRQRGMYHNQWLTADLIGDLSSCGPLGAALVGPFTLTQLGAQRDCLSSNITDLGAQNGTLAEFCQKMSDRLPTELKPLAEAAVGGIQTLANSVEQLTTASGTTFDQRVKDCHDQSVTVAKQFKDLYNKAHTILANATNLATDITYQQSTIGLKNDRVKELLAISKVMREGEEKVVQMKQDEVTANQSHIDKLQTAKKDAEEKRDDTEKLRIIRDVLTLGLGEAGDWGSLNDAMKYADQLIGYADTAIKASTEAKDEAQAAVDALNAELTQYTQLKSDLEGFDPVLQSQLTSMTALATQIHELENHAFDVGLALGSLVGKSSVLPVLHTAQQLATSVLAIETVAKTDNRLSGVFVDNPDTMDASLQAIANSPVQTSETDDEGLV